MCLSFLICLLIFPTVVFSAFVIRDLKNRLELIKVNLDKLEEKNSLLEETVENCMPYWVLDENA